MIGAARIIRGNALALPLADASVDLICTSPPYWSLRAYTDDGQTYTGQLGSEATAGQFIDNLIAATAEMMRVLKPTGSAFINLGDKYGPNKSLMLLPERFRIACIDRLGLIVRSVIIWAKPNGLPESVTDRVRRSHEDWVHLVKQPRYFSAVDEIREEHLNTSWASAKRARGEREEQGPAHEVRAAADYGRVKGIGAGNPLGKLPGSVWTIPTQPLTVPAELGVDHFASYPFEWPRRIIKAWAPLGVCTECKLGLPEWRSSEAPAASNNGMARRVQARAGMRGLRDDGGSAGLRPSGQRNEVVSDLPEAGLASRTADGRDSEVRHPMRGLSHAEALGRRDQDAPEWLEEATLSVRGAVARSGDVPEALHEMEAARRSREGLSGLGVAFCACPVGTPTQPSVVLDCFGGTGTTALVAKALGRNGISVDMSADYSRLAEWRTTDPGQMAAALQVERPEPVSPDQLDLFDEVPA